MVTADKAAWILFCIKINTRRTLLIIWSAQCAFIYIFRVSSPDDQCSEEIRISVVIWFEWVQSAALMQLVRTTSHVRRILTYQPVIWMSEQGLRPENQEMFI